MKEIMNHVGCVRKLNEYLVSEAKVNSANPLFKKLGSFIKSIDKYKNKLGLSCAKLRKALLAII
jgi:hypothetical protein